MTNDVDRDLPTDAGTAADNNDLLALKMHMRGSLPGSPDGSGGTGSATRNARGG
jgi:hypothetical protein